MGEIVKVDVSQLRTVADWVMTAADRIAEMRWPELNPDELAGAAVADVAATGAVAPGLAEVVANMRGWALAARISADAFERAELRTADRVGK
ncbi:hypothetical protein AU184_20040 [Mycolicibacterium novocastrense]|uniref:DUF7162 family protein n=1 Tax=Mycolicibacterium novocastrense TaxID=59813 RepID=UPI0007482505|nr:hypothetical protein [Mycolicibacterium novocastrense]KUH71950.1 hypothetical protein AU072_03835 [Mycolicibacterium novocastrense]KUH72124.1 hypothetical protein AU183_26620 [Mycolicibacterium novocastrense]KUH73075.1 hypothetical protein AU184_20040 [Mycolicibacterium novocastrense]